MNVTDPSLLLRQARLSAATPEKSTKNDAALKEKCQEFEAILIQSMFKGMRSTVVEGGLIEKGNGRQIFEEMRDVEIAKSMAENQGLGIGEALYRQLQEKE